jgi:hypothetical protein
VDFKVLVDGIEREALDVINLREGDPDGLLSLRIDPPIEYGDHVSLIYEPGTIPFRLVGRADPLDGFQLDVFESVAATPTRLTPTGTDVPVVPVDSSTGIIPATLTFASVDEPGTTSIVSSSAGPDLPSGFQLADLYYDISTTATVDGTITVCLSYPETTTGDLRLLHYEDPDWVDVTTSVDLVARVVCGATTSLSPFAVALFDSPFEFSGFSPPVENQPIVNRMKAGAAVPIRFGLGGDFGLSVFEDGFPASRSVPCDSGALTDAIETTVNAGGSSLSYDSVTEQYQYVWKTDKRWNGCRELLLRFTDGEEARATFRFDR